MRDEPGQSKQSDQPDDSEPTPERQAELRAAYTANIRSLGRWRRQRPPYSEVKIRTSGEISWILRERGWSVEQEVTLDYRPDFREADFTGDKLQGVNLHGADLQDATFAGADLNGANLDEADLGTRFGYAATSGGFIRSFVAVWITPVVVLIEFAFLIVLGIRLNVTLLLLTKPASRLFVFLTFGALFLTFAAGRILIYLRDRQRGYGIFGRWIFRGTNLSGASLRHAKFLATYVVECNLQGAIMEDADLGNATLWSSDLSGVLLRGTNLGGTDLRWTVLDSVSALREAVLDSSTNLARVEWLDVPRTRTDVAGRFTGRLFDFRGRRVHRNERVVAARDEARVARTVALALRQQGLSAQAVAYRLEEQRSERFASRLEGKYGVWLLSALLDLVAGYGDKPGRAFVCYLAVVSVFAATYYTITNGVVTFITSHSTHLQWYEALVLSISSFHGRGFFPSVPSLGDPVAVVAAAEAIIGLFIELVFIATFTQRFFAR